MKYKNLPKLAEQMIYDDDIPTGAYLVEAWCHNGQIIVPIDVIPEDESHLHDCDIEGCGTFSHVFRFSPEMKYPQEER